MNPQELGRRFVDVMLGKKIRGEVAAMLPEESVNTRFVVNTGEEFIEVSVPKVRAPISIVVPLPPLDSKPINRGDIFDGRVREAKPWADGQII